jgi:hypothetical protein
MVPKGRGVGTTGTHFVADVLCTEPVVVGLQTGLVGVVRGLRVVVGVTIGVVVGRMRVMVWLLLMWGHCVVASHSSP